MTLIGPSLNWLSLLRTLESRLQLYLSKTAVSTETAKIVPSAMLTLISSLLIVGILKTFLDVNFPPINRARTRARAAGFPREGRKPQRRRRDKRADRPFAKIKELFTKIMRLS